MEKWFRNKWEDFKKYLTGNNQDRLFIDKIEIPEITIEVPEIKFEPIKIEIPEMQFENINCDLNKIIFTPKNFPQNLFPENKNKYQELLNRCKYPFSGEIAINYSRIPTEFRDDDKAVFRYIYNNEKSYEWADLRFKVIGSELHILCNVFIQAGKLSRDKITITDFQQVIAKIPNHIENDMLNIIKENPNIITSKIIKNEFSYENLQQMIEQDKSDRKFRDKLYNNSKNADINIKFR
jgi:hypothetical protein